MRTILIFYHKITEIELNLFSFLFLSSLNGYLSMMGPILLLAFLSLLHRCLDPCGCHWELKHCSTDGIVYGRCNHRAHADDGRLPTSLGREVRVFQNNGFDFRKPRKRGDGIGVEIKIRNLSIRKVNFFGQCISQSHGDAAFHLGGGPLGEPQPPYPGRKPPA